MVEIGFGRVEHAELMLGQATEIVRPRIFDASFDNDVQGALSFGVVASIEAVDRVTIQLRHRSALGQRLTGQSSAGRGAQATGYQAQTLQPTGHRSVPPQDALHKNQLCFFRPSRHVRRANKPSMVIRAQVGGKSPWQGGWGKNAAADEFLKTAAGATMVRLSLDRFPPSTAVISDMQGLPFVLLFTALTFLSWGAYGPLLRYGTTAMHHDGLKAFVGVGLAYFVIAVIVPFWILKQKGEKGRWSFVGTTYSIVAGSVGAIGALGIIFALVFKGNPVYVMPLVFGFAPIVNTLVTAWMGRSIHNIKPIFVAGIIAAALGAGGVLYFKPQPPASDASPNFAMVALSIAVAALCWGSYGPMLHQGQMRMGGSRLRPFACVGIAYFIIAVAAPLVLLAVAPSISQGEWNAKGMTWSVIAGAAGALGALGIVLAFNSGGKPITVMPLVFGFAPVVNTFISLTEAGAWSRVQPMFWVSLAIVIIGAITVLTKAPKSQHAPAHAPASGPSTAPAQS